MDGSRIQSLHFCEHGVVHKPAHTRPGIEFELATICRSHPNVLLVGPDDSNNRVLTKLLPCCPTPVYDGKPESMPAVGRGAVVLRHIESLRPHEQRILHEWFRRAGGRIQVVSLASPGLFELVSTAAFHKGLFYRLNVIMLMTSGT